MENKEPAEGLESSPRTSGETVLNECRKVKGVRASQPSPSVENVKDVK